MGRRLRFALRGILIGVLFAVPVSADAPPGQYGFFVATDEGIEDLKTHLVWKRAVSVIPVAFASATCPKGLRLPTLKELLTLVDEEGHDDYDVKQLMNVRKMIDPAAFGGDFAPVDEGYWSSSSDGDRVWSVDFSTGETLSTAKTNKRYVRCVTFQP